MWPNRKIVNLSLRPPSRDMKRLGVFDLPTVQRLHLENLLTFNDSVMSPTLPRVPRLIAKLAADTGADFALLNLPTFLASEVERELLKRKIKPLYAWGKIQRYSVEAEFGDNEIIKVGFRLSYFIEVGEHGVREFQG